MKQQQFEQRYSADWQAFQQLLEALEQPATPLQGRDYEQFGRLYRRICHFQSLARERRYSSHLVDRLEQLVLRGHRQLYQHRRGMRFGMLRFLLIEFPRLVREQQRYFWLSSLLLYGPALLFFAAVIWQPDLLYSLLPPAQVDRFERMYNPDNAVFGAAREAATNLYMFGYYIENNISVAFRTFGFGLLLGVGSMVILLFNGLLLGGVAGHLSNVGYYHTFFPFVIGHGSFELTAIVIAGAAGLKLGYSLLAPGNLSRIESLKRAGQVAVRLIYGVVFMLVIAAFIEAFWSADASLPVWIKYTIGTGLWLLVILWLTRSGRPRRGGGYGN
ncbi:stage II sporulation protein M [Exilibacterium tricleocarpae]|uniref:Stage II sporulation protein M n=1 Tax=Exilibacterium tricleocarpae TaxID=2591008 RepID=A0A545T2C6_9GAMM|nr:stage II sporulation protein M [Exilibacterium tricleocarpae]TQV71359.1 stage II sporulation protein M [Exilibacterium tricleocarpae]